MADVHTTENKEKRKPERKKLNGRKIADNIMKGAVMLIMAVIFVMLADQLVTTPFSVQKSRVVFPGLVFLVRH